MEVCHRDKPFGGKSVANAFFLSIKRLEIPIFRAFYEESTFNDFLIKSSESGKKPAQ